MIICYFKSCYILKLWLRWSTLFRKSVL